LSADFGKTFGRKTGKIGEIFPLESVENEKDETLMQAAR
jgi:hypothetical protein